MLYLAPPHHHQALLGSCERVVQEVDSVEYGLTDIQEYYANTGALVAAARNARGGGPVACSIVEAFGKEVKPKVRGAWGGGGEWSTWAAQ